MTIKQNNCRINSKPENDTKLTKASFYTCTHYFPVVVVSFFVVLKQVNHSIKVYNIKYQLQIHKLIFDLNKKWFYQSLFTVQYRLGCFVVT